MRLNMEPLSPREARIVEENIGLARFHAQKWIASDKDRNSNRVDDIHQIAAFGLMRAVKVWDESRGSLGTIAWYWIRRLLREYSYEDKLVFAPFGTAHKKLLMEAKLQKDPSLTIDSPEIKNILPKYNSTKSRTAFLEREYSTTVLHMYNKNDNEDYSRRGWIDEEAVLSSGAAPDPEIEDVLDTKQTIEKLLETIDKVHLRFGNNAGVPNDIAQIILKDHCLQGKTMEAIGEEYGVTRQRIDQIKKMAIAKLKILLKSELT